MTGADRPDTSKDGRTDVVPDVTWETLAEAEPELRRLERLALWIAAQAPTDFCANEVWYGFLKPQLLPLVGWSRGRVPECAPDGPRPPFVRLSDIRPAEYVPATTEAERLLRTEAAYDLAYDHLCRLLPDCRHGERLWCA